MEPAEFRDGGTENRREATCQVARRAWELWGGRRVSDAELPGKQTFKRRQSPGILRFLVTWWPLQLQICNGLTIGEALFAGTWITGMLMGSYAAQHDPKKLGHLAGLPFILVWQLACRNSIWTFLLGIPFERALKWHIFAAYVCLAMGVYHGTAATLHLQDNPEIALNPAWLREWRSGWLLFALNIVMAVGASYIVRRRHFNTFYGLHIFLSLLLMGVALYHFTFVVVAGAALWFIDLGLRYIYRVGFVNAKSATVVRLPGNVVRVVFDKGDMRYSAGQYVFLCVPALSLYEWHPFSLSSHPSQEQCSLHVRVLGDWTRRLYDAAGKEATEIAIYLDGPYGAPAVDINNPVYKMFLLVSGGIGITPMQSIANDLIHQHKQGRPMKKIHFVWAVKDLDLVNAMLPPSEGYAAKQLPTRLPPAFQPDLLEPELEPEPETTPGLTSGERAAAEFKNIPLHDDLEIGGPIERPGILQNVFQSDFYLTSVQGMADYAPLSISIQSTTHEYCQSPSAITAAQPKPIAVTSSSSASKGFGPLGKAPAWKLQGDACQQAMPQTHSGPLGDAGGPRLGGPAQAPAASGANPPQTDATTHPANAGGAAGPDMHVPEHPAAVTGGSGPQDYGPQQSVAAKVDVQAARRGMDAGVTYTPGVHRGRPDLPAIVQAMRDLALAAGEWRVGVLSCGPGVMVDDLRRVCRAESRAGVTFDFHGEVFEF